MCKHMLVYADIQTEPFRQKSTHVGRQTRTHSHSCTVTIQRPFTPSCSQAFNIGLTCIALNSVPIQVDYTFDSAFIHLCYADRCTVNAHTTLFSLSLSMSWAVCFYWTWGLYVSWGASDLCRSKEFKLWCSAPESKVIYGLSMRFINKSVGPSSEGTQEEIWCRTNTQRSQSNDII